MRRLIALIVIFAITIPAYAVASARFTAIKGSVSVERNGRQLRAVKNYPVSVGDVVVTEDKSMAEIGLGDGSVLRIAPVSRIMITRMLAGEDGKDTIITITTGKIWSKIKKMASVKDKYAIRTQNAVAGIRGTSFNVEASESLSVVKVFTGEVNVTNIQWEMRNKKTTEVGEPTEVDGPKEIDIGLHEVSIDEWQKIVKAWSSVVVGTDGKVQKPKEMSREKELSDDWIKTNLDQDAKLGW